MGKIEQFVYTSSPWGKSGSGWMVFMESPGVKESDAKRPLYQFFDYKVPSGYDGEATDAQKLATFPVQYVCAKTGDGRRLMSQTRCAGARWWEGRGGDFWAHVLLISEAEWGKMVLQTNPMAFQGGGTFTDGYPEALKTRAKAILNGEEAYQAPPELPSLDAGEVKQNEEWAWEQLKWRLPEGVWRKLGSLLEACVKRGGEAKALVFDATRSESLDTMAVLLELMPTGLRAEAQFATYLHEDNVRETKADETFLFYGTVREGEKADADTGLYGALPEGGVEFAGRGDAELFKRMVDACGEKLGAGEWDALVACWEVATGRIDHPGKLRTAVKFAKGFPGMEAEVAEGLAGAFSDSGVGSDGGRAVALAAWFELGMGAFGDVSKDICGECAGDGVAFGRALRVLEGDGAKAAFLDETYEQAKRKGGLPGLAAMWLDCGADTRRLVPAGSRDRAFGKFTALVDRFAGIRSNVRQGMASTGSAEEMLNEAERAAELLGDDFEGMEETRNGLRYLVALEKVKGMEDLKAFAREAEALGAKQERIREDGLKKVPLGWIPGDKLKAAVEAYGAIGVAAGELIAKVPDGRLLEAGVLDALVAIGAKRDDIIQRALKAAEKAAEQRGYESGQREARRRTDEEERARSKGRMREALRTGLLVALLMALSFGAGWWTGKAGEQAPDGGGEAGMTTNEAVTEAGAVAADSGITPAALSPTDCFPEGEPTAHGRANVGTLPMKKIGYGSVEPEASIASENARHTYANPGPPSSGSSRTSGGHAGDSVSSKTLPPRYGGLEGQPVDAGRSGVDVPTPHRENGVARPPQRVATSVDRRDNESGRGMGAGTPKIGGKVDSVPPPVSPNVEQAEGAGHKRRVPAAVGEIVASDEEAGEGMEE